MQRPVLLFVFLVVSISLFAQSLDYYLPKNVNYNKSIPVPASVIGHEVGEWHVKHNRPSLLAAYCLTESYQLKKLCEF